MSKSNGILAELRVIDAEFVTDWTLRDLEGSWLVESTTPSVVSAKCDKDLGLVVHHAFHYHQNLDPPGDEG